jgi:hypothetical protein
VGRWARWGVYRYRAWRCFVPQAVVADGSTSVAFRLPLPPAAERRYVGQTAEIMTTAKDPRVSDAVYQLAEKAEKIDRSIVSRVYVDMGHVERLNNGTTQYIEGRRGTGKTHLLLYLSDVANARYDTEGTVGVFLDVRDLRGESGQLERDPRGAAKRMFREIISGLARELRSIDAQVLGHNALPKNSDDWSLRTAHRSAEALSELERALRGTPQQSATPARSEVTNELLSQDTRSGITLGADSRLPQLVTIVGAAGAQHSKSTSAEVTETRSYEIRISFGAIRAALENFLDANDLTRLLICIDEWSAVPVAAQPYLAEYLKRTLLPSPRIALKIAVLPFLAKLSKVEDGQPIGFDRGGDIYAGLDLDNELVYSRHPIRAAKLMSGLLHAHLRHFARLRQRDDSLELFDSSEHAATTLFSDSAFRRLLVACQGNPRDFLVLFRNTYLQALDSSAAQIVATAVESGAKSYGIEKLENLQEDLPSRALFDGIISEILQKQRKVAFLVGTRHTADSRLQFLIHQRVLHVWDESYSSPSFSGERFLVLSIDYCIVVEHLKSPKYRAALELPFTDEARAALAEAKDDLALVSRILGTEKPDKRQVRYIVLPDSAFAAGPAGCCLACRATFSSSHPVFMRHGLCPQCGDHVTVQGTLNLKPA